MQVFATDNSPGCFNNQTSYQQEMVDLPRVCKSRIVYHLMRTWNTTDGAGNTASYQQLVAVQDVEVIKFPDATLSMLRTGIVTQVLRVPDPLPNKRYTWVVTQINTQMPLQRTRTGGLDDSTHCAFSLASTIMQPCEYL